MEVKEGSSNCLFIIINNLVREDRGFDSLKREKRDLDLGITLK